MKIKMNRTKILPLFVLPLFILTGLALGAGTNKAEKSVKASPAPAAGKAQTIPLYVGQNVVMQLEDVRESVGDLIAALKDAGVNWGYANWKTEQKTLNDLENKISQMEKRLDRREELADDRSWSMYINEPAFGTTIYQSVNEIGDTLTTIASGLKGGNKKTQNLPIAVADDVVEQVDDIRETVSDFVTSLNRAGENFYYYNWVQDKMKLPEYQQRLQAMEKKLDRKEARADEEWTAWFGADVFKVTIHESVAELGSIMKGIASSMAPKERGREISLLNDRR